MKPDPVMQGFYRTPIGGPMDERFQEIEEEIADAYLSGNTIVAEFTVSLVESLLQRVKELEGVGRGNQETPKQKRR